MKLSDYQQAEANKKAAFREAVKEMLQQKTLDELSYILGRYCGPSNQFLSEKHFGYIMPKDLVEDLITIKSFEDEFLGNE